MTDIVERLRAHPGEGQTVTEQFRNIVEQRHEAAAEIGRLRKTAIETMQEMLRRANEIERLQVENKRLRGWIAPDILELTNEMERLRAARDELLALFRDHYWDSLQKDRDIILLHVEAVLARRALEPKP